MSNVPVHTAWGTAGGVLLLVLQVGIFLAVGPTLVRRLLPSARSAERVFLGAGVSLAVVPTLAFCAAWLVGLPITSAVVLIVSVGTILVCRPWSLPPAVAATRADWTIIALFLAVSAFLITATEFFGGADSFFFDLCLHRSALFLHEFGQDPVTGWTVYQPDLDDYVTYVLPGRSGSVFGFYSVMAAQRPTNGAIVAAWYSLTGRPGLELMSGLVYFVLGGGSALLAGTLVSSRSLSVALGLATMVGLHGLTAYMVNETTFALVSGVLVLVCVTREDATRGGAVLAGLLLALAIGSRPAAAMWLPAIALLAWRRDKQVLLAMLASFVLALAPWLIVNQILRGTPFFYPNASDALVEHDLLGMSFLFRPLNWPFVDHLVRARGHVLPPLLLMPLLVLRSLGSILTAVVGVGLVVLWRFRPRLAWGMVLWSAPITLFLLALAYIDEEKASWILLAAPSVPIGLAAFFVDFKRVWRARLLVVAPISLLLSFAPFLLAAVETPVDERPYGIVEPNEPGHDVHVRYGERWQEELSRVAVVPGLQTVMRGSQLLSSIFAPRPGDLMRSGLVALVLDNVDGVVDSVFSVRLSDEQPSILPPMRLPEGDGISSYLTKGHFLLVEILASDRASVHVHGFVNDRQLEGLPDEHLIFDVEPGPLPHARRYLGILVIKPVDTDVASGRVELRVAGSPVPLGAAGYAFRGEDGTESFHPTLLTNLRIDSVPGIALEHDYEGERWSYRWRVQQPLSRAQRRGDAEARVAAPLRIETPFVY